MNCDWEEFEPSDDRGWRRIRCTHSGFILNPTPSPLDRIFGLCPICRKSPSIGLRLLRLMPHPGNVLRSMIHHATAGAVSELKGDQGGCGNCNSLQVQMNSWGWRGCWKHRHEIMARIHEQAAKHGYRSDWRALCGHVLIGMMRCLWSSVARLALWSKLRS